MKKIFYLVLVAIAFEACSNNKVETDDALAHQRDSLQAIIDSKDNELNDIMGLMNEVQEGISRITEAEGRITVAKAGEGGENQKEIIKDNLNFIQESMKQNKDLIVQLKEKLRASSFNADKLQKTIENLQTQVETQNQQIQELQASLADKDAQIALQGEEINSLNENVSSLSSQNKQQAAKMDKQDQDLNAAWFVFGTKSELKAQNILNKGDVLKNGEFNVNYFTKIDIRKTKNIKLYSKSATILTTHPSGSYTLSKNSDGQYELQITNPTKFWNVSKYLVVQVK